MLVSFSSRSFRNLDDARWRPEAGCHLLLGRNGAGKTSLLEAIYLLSTTRSFRARHPSDCCRLGDKAFHLRGEYEGPERVSLEVGWVADRSYRTVNGKNGSLLEHLEAQPTVAWTAADRDLVTGTPEKRRRFLDQGVVGLRAAGLEVLTQYRRALEQKRRLLLDGGVGLDSWNQILAKAAAALMRERRRYLEAVEKAVTEITHRSGVPIAGFEFRYRPSLPGDGGEDEALLALEEVGKSEREQRRPLLGPHRDDVEFLWKSQPAREVVSAGERKLLGLVVTAARGRVLETHRGEVLYLLDDLDTELDPERLEEVWKLFEGCRQAIVTSSRPAAWGPSLGLRRWSVVGGRVEAE